MSKLPQLNLRIPAEYQDLVRQVAQRLRERDAAGFARDLTYWLNDMPEPGKVQQADLSDLMETTGNLLTAWAELATRVAELEEFRSHFGGPTRENPFTQPPGPPVSEWPTTPQRIDEEVLEAAAGYKAAGATWNYIAQRLGVEAGGDTLRKAVSRWQRSKAGAA